MNNYKFLQSAMLLTLLSTGSYANSDGFYIGANASLVSLGDDSITTKDKDKTKTTYHDVSSSGFSLKTGYQHFNRNRVELYLRVNKLDSDEGYVTMQTVGVNYEWGFSSLSSEKLLPYASVGVGFGDASSKKLKLVDDVDVGEMTVGLGVRYQFNEKIDAQIGFQHIATGFEDYDKTTDDVSVVAQNNIMVSVAYKF